MTLGAPAWLGLLWTVPLLALVLWWAARVRRRDLERLFGAELSDRLAGPELRRRRAWVATLTLLGLALAAIAATQPRWGYTWRDIEHRGVEVVLGVDVSRSMDARDVNPSRLERARREVADLMTGLGRDRVGLVIFAAGAYPRVPLTKDHVALSRILRDTDTSTIQAQGSSLASALRESMGLFDLDEEVSRAIVLLSDGETWDEDLESAVAEVAEAGVRIYAMGIGTEAGAPIPEDGGGFKTDRGGGVVLSRLDESALQRLAAETGGAYVRSDVGTADGQGLLAELRLNLDRETIEVRRERVWDERFQWPLGAGLACLFLAGLLGDGRRRAAVAAGLLLFSTSARAASVDEARELLAEDQPSAALEMLTDLQTSAPDDPRLLWSLGEALYELDRYDEADRVFSELAERSRDRDTRVDARYNAGNSAYHSGRLEDAVEDWEAVLQEEPAHPGAGANAEAVRQEIQRRLQPPEPQDQEGEDGEGEPEDQDGEPQDGEPQDGEGEPQDGEQQEQEDQDSESQDGQTPPEGDGTREEEESTADAGQDPQPELLEEPQDTGAGGGSGELVEGVEEMSEAEAQRLLDGVEEGRPRVIVRGRSGEKDW